MTRVAVIDYGTGNRRSVHKALERAGAEVVTTSDPERLEQADGLVLPGVGAFPAGMENLIARGLDSVIRDAARRQRPLLGICLGMQLLFERSGELGGWTEGLGLLEGEVTRLEAPGLRVPHIGWSDVRFKRPCPLTDGLPAGGCAFYHVHSLAVRPAHPEDVVGTTEYGERFATIVARESVLGVQFHPEKSSRDGLRMLGAFVSLCAQRAGAPGAVRA